MASARWTTIPRYFNWVLPAQSLATGVSIYATVYVFGVGTIPFILGIVATGIQVLFGLYLCVTASRPGTHHRYIVPAWVSISAGVWVGPIYYFARALDLVLKIKNASGKQSDMNTWTEVGAATTSLCFLLNVLLLVLFIIIGGKRPAPPVINSYQASGTTLYTQVAPNPQYVYQQQPPQYAASTSHPTMVDTKSTYTATTTPVHTQAAPSQPPYDWTNRIDVMRRIIQLQNQDGHWEYSQELAGLVKHWGRRELTFQPEASTALTNACLADLLNYVWAAQRERREQTSLSAAELASLQSSNWDLNWVKAAIDRATAWSSGFR